MEILKAIYNGEFKNLIYGVLPKDEDVLLTMKKIKERLANITWNIKIETKK